MDTELVTSGVPAFLRQDARQFLSEQVSDVFPFSFWRTKATLSADATEEEMAAFHAAVAAGAYKEEPWEFGEDFFMAPPKEETISEKNLHD